MITEREEWMKMRKETDLGEVKAMAKTFLRLDIKKTELAPLIVKHPFTDSSYVMLPKKHGGMEVVELFDNEEALRAWRKIVSEQIDKADSVFKIFYMITKPYCSAFLKLVQPSLSRENFSETLGYVWVRCEAPSYDPNISQKEYLAMFRAAEPTALMSKEEYKQFCSLGDTVTVYRGVTSDNADNVKALSWTLKRETAEWFSCRFDKKGMVYEAKIGKEHILAYFDRGNEEEIILVPGFLKGLKKA